MPLRSHPSRRAAFCALGAMLAGCDALITLEETRPSATLEVSLPDDAAEQFLDDVRAYARSSDFSFHARALAVPGSGVSIAFEMRRADMWVMGQNIAEHVSDDPPPGMIGPTIVYAPGKFSISLYAREQPPNSTTMSIVMRQLEAIVLALNGSVEAR